MIFKSLSYVGAEGSTLNGEVGTDVGVGDDPVEVGKLYFLSSYCAASRTRAM